MAGAFTVPTDTLTRLATTRPAPRDLALLHAALHSRRLVLFKALLTRLDREPVPPKDRAEFERHWRLLERAEAHHPSAARRALDYPSVGNWLVCALNEPDEIGLAAALPYLGGIAATTALETGVRLDTTLRTTDDRLVLPGLGVHRTRARHVRIRSGPRGMLLRPVTRGRTLPAPVVLRPGGASGAGPGWHGLPVLPGSDARLDDLTGTHPSRRAWPARWRGALALLESADPWRAAEVTRLVRSVVPMAPVSDGATSGTLRAAPWAVHTALPDTARRLAEVLVHELAHSKLAVLDDLVALHHADGAAVHRVAWRTDPRPFAGVLQGTYAHLALADLWSRVAARPVAAPAARRAARARREEYREQVADALPVLFEGYQLTSRGVEFTQAMKQHLRALGAGSE